MTNSETEKELQEKLLAYRVLENRLGSLGRQQNIFASRIIEIQNTIDSINELKKGKKNVLFSLGSAAYTKGTVADEEKLIIEVGAGVALEKTADEGKAILEKRKKELEDAMTALQKDMQSVASMMQKIEVDTQEIISESQKEQQFGVVSSE